MQIHFCNSNDKEYQKRLNAFIAPIFLDFQFWYDLNLWDENYESYSIMQDDEIVSNLCLYKTEIVINGKKLQALQMGAVATKKELQGRGYARLLMEHVLNKYPTTPMYLYANNTVLDFYPKFGFTRADEKLPVTEYEINNEIAPVKLKFDDPLVWQHVSNRVNFSQELDCLNTASLNMFHIHLGYLKDHIYHLPELETIVIATNDDELKIWGVFSQREITFAELAEHLPFTGVDEVVFGFMPCWPDLEYELIEHETEPKFVRGDCDFSGLKFPELSMT